MTMTASDAWVALAAAFGSPIFLGDIGVASVRDRDLLAHERDLLAKRVWTAPEDEARAQYLLGVAARHLDEHELAERHFQKAAAADPKHLEADLALRAGRYHQDLFCVPDLGHLMPGATCPWSNVVLFPEPKLSRTYAVRHDGEVLAAFVVRISEGSLRRSPSEIEHGTVIGEIETVRPGTFAIGSVMAVLFDDNDDPFFRIGYVNLFGIADRPHPPDYDPGAGRSFMRRFSEHGACALIVVEGRSTIAWSRVVHFEGTELKRLKELGAIVREMGDEGVAYDLWKSTAQAHDQQYIRHVRRPVGSPVTLPLWRDPTSPSRVVPVQPSAEGATRGTPSGRADSPSEHWGWCRQAETYRAIEHAHQRLAAPGTRGEALPRCHCQDVRSDMPYIRLSWLLDETVDLRNLPPANGLPPKAFIYPPEMKYAYFVSHRWLSAEHPDPSGGQLAVALTGIWSDHDRYRTTYDCPATHSTGVWYDFLCLPPMARDDEGESAFRAVLRQIPSMVVCGVPIVITNSQYAFATRAWCVAECMAAHRSGFEFHSDSLELRQLMHADVLAGEASAWTSDRIRDGYRSGVHRFAEWAKLVDLPSADPTEIEKARRGHFEIMNRLVDISLAIPGKREVNDRALFGIAGRFGLEATVEDDVIHCLRMISDIQNWRP